MSTNVVSKCVCGPCIRSTQLDCLTNLSSKTHSSGHWVYDQTVTDRYTGIGDYWTMTNEIHLTVESIEDS